jgi:hypothetical protein
MSDRRPRVFISHASDDAWVARQIEGHVRNCGAETFLDAVHIQHGDSFDDKIIDAAADATELLVLLTPEANERKYIWLEIGMFLVARKRVVVVLYRLTSADLAIDRRTPVSLKRVDAVQIDSIEEYFSELRARVAAWEAQGATTT